MSARVSPRRRTLPLLLAIGLALVALGCKDKPVPLAKLAEAAGPVERAVGAGAWTAAPIGTGYFLGDAARTGDGSARLALGGSSLKMDPHTIVRFGGKPGGKRTLAVELGAFELTGAGDFGLGLGEINIGTGGGVRVVAGGDGKTSIELTLGDARYIGEDGKALTLSLGAAVDISLGDIAMTPLAPIDARPPDDAAPVVVSALQLTIAGPKAQLRATPDGAWSAAPAGDATLPEGGALKLGPRTTATATGSGLALELASGAELAAGGTPFASLRAGRATAGLPDGSGPRIAVPGATIGRAGAVPAAAAIDVGKVTTVTASRGAIELVGKAGKMTLQRGETVTINRDGTIDLVYDVPDYYDLKVDAGDAFTVHDPKGATAVRIDWGTACGGDGDIEIARGGDFAGARRSGGSTAANVMVPTGSWRYRVRCDATDKIAASGSITVRRDDGRRLLPSRPSTNVVDADGRDYRIVYQNLIPTVEIRWPKAPGTGFRLQLGTGKKARTLTSATPKFSIPGTELTDGTYPFTVERTAGGTGTSKTSRLIIEFDNATPAAAIELPRNGEPWGGSVAIKGVALPGWKASVDGSELTMDRQGRFAGTVGAPGAAALAILLSHPQRGRHYYLRRQR